ncbi:MAG TPA: PqqD family protein, partial [Allosphingosinicella sp.]|nr:PqqD family protein [Allosphingosinicella sp.]
STSCVEIYRLSEGVLSVPVEDETVLLAMGSEKYFGVRGAMRHLLESLRDGLSLEAMVADTCTRYGVAAEVARRDLEAILPKLIAAGIVIRSGR